MTNHSFDNQMSPETYLCHGPFDPEVFGGVVNPPVYHASTVIFKNCKELNERHQALFEDAEDEVMYYGRFGTPITFAVQKALAELEGGVPIFTGAYRAGSMHQCITGSGKKWRSYSCQ
ncbi:PLP-dependent transferase [Klebsiella pneumoniae]|nr:PLP-dependent transferase [Klebsiella pneumoniae]MDN2625630.1 PLP-dependent transferase [Klebsiella pneumoniae]